MNRKVAELGYDLSPNTQRQGKMLETIIRIIDFGFKELNLTKIAAYNNRNNEASTRLLKRNGFQFIEGKEDKNDTDNIFFELHKEQLDSNYHPSRET